MSNTGRSANKLELLPGIERSPMGAYVNLENLTVRYETGGGIPSNRSFTENEYETMQRALKPE